MLISALTLAVRTFTLQAPVHILYNVYSVGLHKYNLEFLNTSDSQIKHVSLDGIQSFTVYPASIEISYPNSTLRLTKTGMEWC